jgi:hypothetical protein
VEKKDTKDNGAEGGGGGHSNSTKQLDDVETQEVEGSDGLSKSVKTDEGKEKEEEDDGDVITITANDGSLGRGHLIAPRPQLPEEDDDEVELLDEDDGSNSVKAISNSGQDEDALLADEDSSIDNNSRVFNEMDSSLSNDVVSLRRTSNNKGGQGTDQEDEDDVLLISDEDDYTRASSTTTKDSTGSSRSTGLSRDQQAMFAKSGLIIESVRGGVGVSKNNNNQNRSQDDDVMEIQNTDSFTALDSDDEVDGSQGDGDVEMLGQNDSNGVLVNDGDSNEGSNSDLKEIGNEDDPSSTIVVNNTKSLVELANSKQEPGKEPTLVIIDTNSILSGKGPLPAMNNKQSRGLVEGGTGTARASPTPKNSAIDIPDDAFLIEAPSFIVPYVFEQSGDKSMKEKIKEVGDKAKEDKEAKIAKGEALTAQDQVYEPKKPASEDYFESPVGRLLMNIGVNLVQEFVQVDLLKFQKRQGEKEKKNSRMGMMTHMTQQSIISLKRNIDETKENNEPFKSKMKKCELCNFKTESELVMSTHLETPHMRNYSYRCNFCTYTTRVPHEIIFHMEAEHTVKARLERYTFFYIVFNLPHLHSYIMRTCLIVWRINRNWPRPIIAFFCFAYVELQHITNVPTVSSKTTPKPS